MFARSGLNLPDLGGRNGNNGDDESGTARPVMGAQLVDDRKTT